MFGFRSGSVEGSVDSSSSGTSATEIRLAARTSLDLSQRLREVVKANNGFQFVQKNGQRIFAPCPYMKIPPPPQGCEIFIGKIPSGMFEDELIPLLQTVGKLYQFRMMLDFQQKARGYAFATFLNPNHVPRAIEKFNGYPTRFGIDLQVYLSMDNRRLFFGNIPKDKTRDEIFAMCTINFTGVTDVIMFNCREDNTKNRGFAFVEFETQGQATVTRQMLHPKNLIAWNSVIYVDWAEPKPEVDPNVMAQVTVLYVKNLPYEWDQQEASTFFLFSVGIDKIAKTHKIDTFAFVHCKNRRAAEIAKTALTGLRVGQHTIEVEWARPREYSPQFKASQTSNSVPVRRRRGFPVKRNENARFDTPETFDRVKTSVSKF